MLLVFDIGGTKCAVILGKKELDGTINRVEKVAFPTDRPVYEMIELIFSQAEKILAKAEIQPHQLRGIGISCGGHLSSKRGLILSPPICPDGMTCRLLNSPPNDLAWKRGFKMMPMPAP